MDHILKDLNSELLQSWGFQFDGNLWSHNNYPFTLTKTNDGYLPVLPNGDTNLRPMTTATELLHMITQVSALYLQREAGDQKYLNKQVEMQRIGEILNKYFSFDPNLKFGMHLDQSGGGSLAPANAYTLTLLSGIEVAFKVIHGSKSKAVTDTVYMNPSAMGYHVLKKYFNDDILSVSIECTDGTWEPFYGVGIE